MRISKNWKNLILFLLCCNFVIVLGYTLCRQSLSSFFKGEVFLRTIAKEERVKLFTPYLLEFPTQLLSFLTFSIRCNLHSGEENQVNFEEGIQHQIEFDLQKTQEGRLKFSHESPAA